MKKSKLKIDLGRIKIGIDMEYIDSIKFTNKSIWLHEIGSGWWTKIGHGYFRSPEGKEKFYKLKRVIANKFRKIRGIPEED